MDAVLQRCHQICLDSTSVPSMSHRMPLSGALKKAAGISELFAAGGTGNRCSSDTRLEGDNRPDSEGDSCSHFSSIDAAGEKGAGRRANTVLIVEG
jgi:hypothetical protein